MNINFFITSLGGGGAERVVCNLANYLVKKGHRITITVLRGDDETYVLEKGVLVEYLQPDYYKGNKSKLYRLKEISSTISFLKHLPEDSLLVSMLELPVAYSLLFRSLYKQKLIICERNNPEFYSKGYQYVFRKLAHRADGCVCQTTTIMEWYITIIHNKTQTAIIPNSINESVLKAAVSERKDKIIMTMGRLEPQKNQKMLISAFAEVAKVYPEYKLYIYGKGPLENDLQNQIECLGVMGKVELKGFIKDTVSAFRDSSCFVLTSNHEGMPNVLAEAMAMGLPCISTDCGGGGAKELIANGLNGILIPKNDKALLVESLKRLIDDQLYAKSLANEAIKIRERLAPDAIHLQWESFLNGFTA